MNAAAIPVQNPAVLARKIFDDEMVLVNADNAASLALTNQTAILVWEMVDGRNSIQNIVDGIKNEFRDVPESVTDDIRNLLNLLARDGFVGFEYENHA